MEKAYKFLIAGLAIGLVLAAAATFAYTSSTQPQQLDCKQCHEGHGSVVAPDVNMNGTLLLTGDTPQDEYVVIDDIFKLRQIEITTLKQQDGVGVPSKGVSVYDFLQAHGVTGFDRLVFYADDYEMTLNKSEMSNETIFVPMEYSIRVLGPNMPVNVWAKNIRAIVVVGGNSGDSIQLNGKELTYGQMIDDGMDSLVYSSKTTGYAGTDRDYQYQSAFVVPGIRLDNLLAKEGFAGYSNVTIKGPVVEKTYTRDETAGLLVTRDQGKIKIASSDKARANWMGVEAITAE
ncbi:MAG TPA: hypothetical protein VMC84_03265 [Methanocella sp.]|uniref:hypothetical protein n=1 Tax=Methanocella sp. TaxID=2052833 RepID=UPI002B5FC9AA|nr:hypothetical protein [Methanocella sp.]HTY90173.1 hypothetical protein [Methanocella sp.]